MDEKKMSAKQFDMRKEEWIVESVNTLSFRKRTCAKPFFKKAFTEKRFAERNKIGGGEE